MPEPTEGYIQSLFIPLWVNSHRFHCINTGVFARDPYNFSLKIQTVNILGFVGHTVSLAATQFSTVTSRKTARDNM